MRDLIHEGCAYLDGAAYDPVILGLAAVGLTIAVVTVTILGATTPARVGATVLKAASKGGRLSKPLRGELVRLAGDAVDGEALRATVTLARAGDLAAACATLRGVLRLPRWPACAQPPPTSSASSPRRKAIAPRRMF
ncbi:MULTISPECIES: hypothetical protein [unclassified Mesorhizobium]|uniref:hypothetical protein n=1 Tax=unclassified Mesorhizobium TaxID=325217 RepID=UPI00333A08A9